MKHTTGKRCLSALASSLLCTVVACAPKAAPVAEPLPVHTSGVRTIEVGNGAKYSASIVPYAQVDLSFQSGGYVDRIRMVKNPSGGMRTIDQGDVVTAGTVLARVEQQSYTDKRDQAKAQLGRAQADLDKAQLTFDRTSALYGSHSATKPDYDSAQAQLASTTASLSGAKAQVSEAEVALAHSELRAPFSGQIVKRSVDVGSLVGPATNGFTLADTRTVKAVFGIPDTSMNRVRLGQQLSISTDALPQPIVGRVSAISPSADPKSRVFSVEVTLPNARGLIKSGMIATLTVNGEQLPQSVVAVPLAAIIRDPSHPGGFAVMVAEGNGDTEKARLRPVSLGDTFGNTIAVQGGLAVGERVVTTGATLIKDGDTIRVIP